MVLEILTVPHPTLTQKAVDAVPSADLSLLLHSMVETLRATPDAIGLAAPQVGVSLRAFVMGTEEQGYLAICNPRIVKRSGVKVPSVEGCLSVPGKTVTVKRDSSITVKGINAEGHPFTLIAKGNAAFVIQHEVDHLSGVTIG